VKSILAFTQPLIKVPRWGVTAQELHIGSEKFWIHATPNRAQIFPANCPHRGTPTEYAVCKNSQYICRYHGKPISPLPFHLVKKFGFWWNIKGEESVPFQNEKEFSFCGSDRYILEIPFVLAVDNFNEGSHTPYIHSVTGPLPNEWNQTKFEWSENSEQVKIFYSGPQRNTWVLHGLRAFFPQIWREKLQWSIRWTVDFNPLRMTYHSIWHRQETPETAEIEMKHLYYLAPLGNDQTIMHTFCFMKRPNVDGPLGFILKGLARKFTKNQIREDQKLYPMIKDSPLSLDKLKLDEYDQPLLAIREKCSKLYFKL